ncbi:hypothetical protein J2772_002461 [Chryseobacterium jejuense]|nr:hypothetical protein [Chryseobacterium jejuense]
MCSENLNFIFEGCQDFILAFFDKTSKNGFYKCGKN